MKKKLGIFLLCITVILSGFQMTPNQAYAWTLNEETHFATGFDAYESDIMEMANWSNGGMFNCTWTPDNIAFQDGIMSLTIDSDGNGGYTGAEYRTQEAFGYGMFSVSMKPIKNPGVVTSFFTYTGPTDGTVWDEIDIEFLGYDTTKVQFNYYTNGVGGHEYLYDLGFDASEEFHTYAFYWGEGVITWYVDGVPVYTATENIPTTPGRIMMNVWPGIGVDGWLQPFDGKTPLTGYYDWMAYDAPLTDTEGSTEESSSAAESTEESSSEATEESTESSQEESAEEIIVAPGKELTFQDDQLYIIISKNSGKALDVSYGTPDNGTNVLQYTYCGYDNQKWYIQKLDNGYYIIKNYATDKVLSVQDFSTENGGNVHQWEYVGNTNQEWSLEYTDGYYKFINRNSGLLLDVSGISVEDNANVQQWEDVSQDNQLWMISALGVTEDGSEEETTAESETTPESSEESSEIVVTPSKVTGVQAVYEDGQIKLTWDDNGAAQYRVMRFDGITPGYTTLTYRADAAGYIDTDLIDVHRYYYRVCGYFYDADGNLVQGGVSDAVGVVATDRDPSKVENVSAVISDGNVTLTWDAADGVRYYKIARAYGATAAEGSYACLKYNVEETTYTDTGVSAGNWRYKVVGYYKAVDNSWVYGEMSNTLFLTVE